MTAIQTAPDALPEGMQVSAPGGRYGGTEWWAATNRQIGEGETVKDTGRVTGIKIGPGHWNDLPYVTEPTALPNADGYDHMTAAEWIGRRGGNRTVDDGEIVWETDTGRVKIGDGITPYAFTPFVAVLFVEVG